MKKIFTKLKTSVKKYSADNPLVVVFIIISVINAFMLRSFTLKFTYNQIKPLLADTAAVMLFSLPYFAFKKPKGKFAYLMVMNFVLTFLVVGNSIYYTNFKSFMSFSLLSTASQLGGVVDAVTQNILEPKDLTMVWTIPALIITKVMLSKKAAKAEAGEDNDNKGKNTQKAERSEKGKKAQKAEKTDKTENDSKEFTETAEQKRLRRKYALSTFCTSLVIMGIFCLTLSGTDYSRLRKQWNREYVLGTFGMYVYQASDAVTVTYSKINLMFGYEEKKDAFNEFYEDSDNKTPEEEENSNKNKYTNIFKGKNVIVIHCESMQQFCMDTYMNGEELTPNLNKLAREGIYFSNFYAQESVGTSSDTEFTFSTSLMPASSGTVAINYWDRNYASTQKFMKEMGYYVYSMHGNNGTYWNRLNLHSSLGYDKLYNYTDDFIIDDTIGLGLSDKSFFGQAIPIMKQIDSENKNWYGCLIMLTNHTPFTDIERVSNYDVTFKFKRFNDETGLYEDISAPFLEGTRLGSYFKSVHYADEALGQLMEDLDSSGLLDNTVFVLYGDHDAKVKPAEYDRYINYDPFNDKVLTEEDEGYVPVDDFYYNVNRKVPLIIWSKGGEYEPTEITKVMGMYDVQPTLGNMLGFENNYALGRDIFSLGEDEENVVIFPNGNFITNKVYYDNQKDMYFDLDGYENVMTKISCNQVYKDTPNPLYTDGEHGLFKYAENKIYCRDACDMRINDGAVDEWYIDNYSDYAAERIDISNAIIMYDMINDTDSGFAFDKRRTDDTPTSVFAPPDPEKRRSRIAV